MTRVDEIMHRRVISVTPEMTLSAVVDMFTERHVGGAPVVDSQGQVVGMVSEVQLLDVVFDLEAREMPVSAYMTPNVECLRPDDSLTHVAQLFALYSYRRLPVVDDGVLVGVVTRRDLMNYALRTGKKLAEPLFELIPDLAEITWSP
jgi:CBS domain-containing protein